MAFRSSRKSRRSSFKKRKPSTKSRRSLRRKRTTTKGGGSGSDVYHFKETINAGVIGAVASGAGTEQTSTGAFIMRLTDFPAFQRLGPNFEFARLNKCKIEFLPKANMQLNQLTPTTSTLTTVSPSGTLVVGMDEVPVYTSTAGGTYIPATTWSNDQSNDTGITSASAVKTSLTTSYIRGIRNSKEKEFYKKQSISFFPAFYDYIMSGLSSGDIGGISNTINVFENNGCVERKIKKWISITNATSAASPTIATNVGPLYYGPVYAVNNNVATTGTFALYDVRMTYSLSFKRLKGV